MTAYILLSLAFMTNIGTFQTEADCMNAMHNLSGQTHYAAVTESTLICVKAQNLAK